MLKGFERSDQNRLMIRHISQFDNSCTRLEIIMNSICFFFIITFLLTVTSHEPSLSQQGEINYVSFSENHLFYLSKSGNQFGFISRHSGQLMSQYKLQEHQSIISVHKASESVILRTGRNKFVLFDIRSSHLEEINIKINFKHQQIVDAFKSNGKYYVLTDKDARVYTQNQEKMDESLKNIIASGRKNEYFKKFFLNEDENLQNLLIVLIKNGQICIRRFKESKKGVDQCYFKIPYEIVSIDRINRNILIQTETINYIIPENSQQTYSFQGRIMQTSAEFLQLSQFKTYDLQNQIFLEGKMVEGSTLDHVFWIHYKDNHASIFYNSQTVQKIMKIPRRSWVSHLKNQDKYDLLIEFDDNMFEMYQITIRKGNTALMKQKWKNSPLKHSEQASEL